MKIAANIFPLWQELSWHTENDRLLHHVFKPLNQATWKLPHPTTWFEEIACSFVAESVFSVTCSLKLLNESLTILWNCHFQPHCPLPSTQSGRLQVYGTCLTLSYKIKNTLCPIFLPWCRQVLRNNTVLDQT